MNLYQHIPALEKYRGKKVVLYFYPKDMTPGCTCEAVDFRDLKEEFERLGAVIVGVSPDSEDSHQAFKEKENLNFELISDPDKDIMTAFGVYGEKKNYGRIVKGVIRSTFLFDEDGHLMEEMRNVRAKGHAARVLKALQK